MFNGNSTFGSGCSYDFGQSSGNTCGSTTPGTPPNAGWLFPANPLWRI